MNSRILTLILTTPLLIAGCGNQTSQKDREQEQPQATILEKENILTP